MHSSFRSRIDHFALALSLLNLNFIPDPGKALQELSRVTHPGGTVAAAVWDYGQGMEMLRAFWDEAVALNREADARDERHMGSSADGEALVATGLESLA